MVEEPQDHQQCHTDIDTGIGNIENIESPYGNKICHRADHQTINQTANRNDQLSASRQNKTQDGMPHLRNKKDYARHEQNGQYDKKQSAVLEHSK